MHYLNNLILIDTFINWRFRFIKICFEI